MIAIVLLVVPVDRNLVGWHPDNALVLPDGHRVTGSLVVEECLPHGLAQRIEDARVVVDPFGGRFFTVVA